MTITTLNQQVDLDEYPTVKELPEDSTELIFGDLHGNPVVLINRLIAYAVIEMSPENYLRLLKFYYAEPHGLNKKELGTFEDILQTIEVKNPNIYIRLIGDETGDRGLNDYLTLKVFERLDHLKIPFEIMFSNHGFEFIYALEIYGEDLERWPGTQFLNNPDTFANSLVEMINLVEHEIISNEAIQDLYQRHYLPHLKLVGCSFLEDTVSIFSHAPIGIDTVSEFAIYLDVEYSDHTPEALAETIFKINEQFSKLAERREIHRLFEESYGEGNENPFYRAIWSRSYHDILREAISYVLRKFVHGHDSTDPFSHPEGPILCIDGELGKALNQEEEITEATETTLCSNEQRMSERLEYDSVDEENEAGSPESPSEESESEESEGSFKNCSP